MLCGELTAMGKHFVRLALAYQPAHQSAQLKRQIFVYNVQVNTKYFFATPRSRAPLSDTEWR
jgi:hypothetical protein